MNPREITTGQEWDHRFTHKCPICLLLTEGERTCRGDLFPSVYDSHAPCLTVALTPGLGPR
jgi:hypothetical protein